MHDNEDIVNFVSLKNQLKNISNVAYCGLSVSGEGFFLLIPIAYPEKYELHFESFVESLSEFGIKADKSCRNISRLRGYSYDDAAYFNFDAETYYGLKFPQRIQRYDYHKSNAESDIDILIMKICNRGIDITGDYKDWFAIGCAFVSEFGEDGRSRFHSVSRLSDKYNERECDKQYTNCLRTYSGSGYTIGTFFYRCVLYGITLKG